MSSSDLSTADAFVDTPGVDGQRLLPKGRPQALDSADLQVQVFDSFEAARPIWSELEASAVLTPYQGYDWVSRWHAARGSIGRLAIIVVSIGGKPVALLPLEIGSTFGLKRARIVGTEIGNSDWMIVEPSAASLFGREELRRVLTDAARHAGGIDLLSFHDQPRSWNTIDNPLLTLPHQPGPNRFYFSARGTAPSFDRFEDKRVANLLRRKRKLAEMMGPVTLRAATTIEEIDAIQADFLEQRGARFAQKGITNLFAEPHFVKFMREGAIDALGETRPAFIFHGLYAGETIVATAFGTFTGTHYSQYINATAGGEIAKFRLIGILMHELFADCVQRGATTIDMGLGDFDYKTDWTEPQTAYDSVVPLSPLGQVAAPALLAARRAKRAIKQNPTLWRIATAIRSRLNRNAG